MKKAGLLLAISSLPSEFGIGDLGESTYEFVDISNKQILRFGKYYYLHH